MKKTVKIILILCLLLVALIFANRDLMHYEYSFLCKRTFDPELDAKRSYVSIFIRNTSTLYLSEAFSVVPLMS